MNRAIDQFNINIETVKHLGVIYSAFESHLTPAVDTHWPIITNTR